MKKTIWLVNEYNVPGYLRTRQTVLSQRLEELGYNVCLICGSSDYKGGENAIAGKDPVVFTKFDGASFYIVRTSDYKRNAERALVAIQFQERLWKHRRLIPKPDVIVSDFAGWFGNVFLRWKRKYGTKIIYDILDLWPEGFVDMGYLPRKSLITKMLYAMEHRSYRYADGIIFSFEGGRRYIIDKGWSKEVGGKVDTSNIGYLNNGVDLETLDIEKDKYVLEDDDLDSNLFKVIYLGSVSAFNGLDVLVETARELEKRGRKDIIILIYGYGNQEEALKKMAADYHLNNIKFKGKLDKHYAMNLLSRGDINVFTFKDTPLLKYGTSPNKLFMYFSSAKPVLSMIRPAYDLVESRNCGISVENDPAAVADAIISFASMDREQYDEYCSNSRKVAEEYDYKNLVKVLVDKIEN